MNHPQTYRKALIDALARIGTLEDIDPDICAAAREAQSIIENQEMLIELLAGNEARLRRELDDLQGIIR